MQKYPKALDAYSVFKKADDWLFISGQLAIDPNTNELSKDDIKEQTKIILNNIKAILNENNLNLSNIIKTTIFLTNMDDFSSVNEIYASFFDTSYPARSVIAVKALPKDANIEIEVIACEKI